MFALNRMPFHLEHCVCARGKFEPRTLRPRRSCIENEPFEYISIWKPSCYIPMDAKESWTKGPSIQIQKYYEENYWFHSTHTNYVNRMVDTQLAEFGTIKLPPIAHCTIPSITTNTIVSHIAAYQIHDFASLMLNIQYRLNEVHHEVTRLHGTHYTFFNHHNASDISLFLARLQ